MWPLLGRSACTIITEGDCTVLVRSERMGVMLTTWFNPSEYAFVCGAAAEILLGGFIYIK